MNKQNSHESAWAMVCVLALVVGYLVGDEHAKQIASKNEQTKMLAIEIQNANRGLALSQILYFAKTKSLPFDQIKLQNYGEYDAYVIDFRTQSGVPIHTQFRIYPGGEMKRVAYNAAEGPLLEPITTCDMFNVEDARPPCK